MNHPKFVPLIRAFREHGGGSRRAKFAAVAVLTGWLCGLSVSAIASTPMSIGQYTVLEQTFNVGGKRMRFAAGEGLLVDKDDASRNGLPVRWLTVTDIDPSSGKLLYEEIVQDWPLGAVQFNADMEVLVAYWESSTSYRVMAFRTKANAVTKIFDAYSKTFPSVRYNASGDIVFELSKDCAGGFSDCRPEEYIVRPGGD